MMNCDKCGTKLMQGDNFCFYCGAKVSKLCEDTQIKWKDTMTNKYDSYGSGMYGDGYCVEYKGSIYCLMPKAELTKKGFSERYSCGFTGVQSEKDLVFIRLGIENNKIEILKEFEIKKGYSAEQSLSVSYYFGSVPFTIYDNKLYYYFCEYSDWEKEKEYTAVICLDVDSKKETQRIIKRKNADSRVLGVFKGTYQEVYVVKEYDYRSGAGNCYIYDFSGVSKKKLGKNFERIEGYNEQYVYYSADNKLYYVDLDTFEITNLSTRIKKVKNGEFYGVDTRNDTIYVLKKGYGEEMKMVSINVQNQINEFLVPQLPIDIQLPTYKQLPKHINARGDFFGVFDKGFGISVFFNGESWIIKINPEDVEMGMLEGIVVFDKNGKEIGRWLHEKRSDYINCNRVRFMLPSALLVGYKVEDERGNDTNLSNFREITTGQKYLCARMIYCTQNGIKDSKTDFYYKTV